MPVPKSSQKKTAKKKTSRKKTTKKRAVIKKAVKKKISEKKKSQEKKTIGKSSSPKKSVKKETPKKGKTIKTPAKKAPGKKSLSKKTTRRKTSVKKDSAAGKAGSKKTSAIKGSLPSPYKSKKNLNPKHFFSTELPQKYNTPYLRAIPRDPYWIFLYWELTQESFDSIQKTIGKKKFSNANFILRVSDISGIEYTGTNALHYFDIEINLYTNNWYVKVPHPGKTYCIEYACVTNAGTFYQILQSNPVYMPRDSISDTIDEKWATSHSHELIHFSAGSNLSLQDTKKTRSSLFPGSSDNLFVNSSRSK